jgi:HD superfamily phosphodiesterase
MQSSNNMTHFVISLLQEKLPSLYTYHSYHHTLYVLDKVAEIGMHENCTNEEIVLLKAGALWHDTGFISVYLGHEEAGCDLAKLHMPNFEFSVTAIDIICSLIRATKIPQQPKTRLEAIIADADLEYLGSTKAKEIAETLFIELQTLNPQLTRGEWNKQQIAFLQNHQYFTNYCKALKEPVKQAYLKMLLAEKN